MKAVWSRVWAAFWMLCKVYAVITEHFHRRVAITIANLTLDDTYTNSETLEEKNKPGLNNTHRLKRLWAMHNEGISENEVLNF